MNKLTYKKTTMLQGIKTPFFTDVKSNINAGMQFIYPGTKNNKMQTVGKQVTRIYFDNADKDSTVGQEVIKRTFKS